MSAPLHVLPEGDGRPLLAPARRLPRAGEPLLRGLRAVDRLFDRVYGSALNPLYQTGSLVVAMLLVMVASGLYLFLLYETGRPYASMQKIEQDAIGAFARSLHRYSADASVVLVVIHAVRMFLQGKNWGARTLAWVSGIGALGVLFFCGWTGLILVFDELGIELAEKGARILDLVPIFPEPLVSTFSGATPLGASFVFTNLFLHVSLPLGLLAAIGVHVLRLSRPRLLPPRRVFVSVVVGLAALSLVWPITLSAPADVRALAGSYDTDWFFAFWLPLVDIVGPAGTVAALGLVAVVALTAGLWWRPPPAEAPRPSFVDEPNCRGCAQCYEDCPYGAISMVPRSVGTGSESVALVDPDLCTSCGVCSASCDVLRVGPPGKRGRDLLQVVKRYAAERDLEGALVMVGCTHNPAARALELSGVRLERFPVECAGSLHLTSVRAFLKRGAAGVVLHSCTPREAPFRDGPHWLRARLDEGRPVGLPKDADRERVLLLGHTEGELDDAYAELASFAAAVGASSGASSAVSTGAVVSNRARSRRVLRWAARMALSAGLLFALASPRLLLAGSEPEGGVLRLAWRDGGPPVEVCRALSEAERAALPAHMQRVEQCSRRYLDHQLRVVVNGHALLERRVTAGGARQDRPSRVLAELPLSAGVQQVLIEYRALHDEGDDSSRSIRLEQALRVEPGRVYEVGYDEDAGGLFLRP